jgi:AcrR family transcriptional regulator
MAENLSERSGDAGERELGTPLGASLRAEQLGGDGQVGRELELAALEVSGEVGYRKLTVQRILDRSGVSRGRFYKIFSDKADCYQQGYAVAIERLEQELLGSCAQMPSWLPGFQEALLQLADFINSEPLLARGLLAEVHVAGGAAMAKRKEVFERLSRAIDAARRENESRHSPPPITASFILSAFEAAVVRSFRDARPSAFAEAVPDLTHIAVSVYFGERAARAAVADN